MAKKSIKPLHAVLFLSTILCLSCTADSKPMFSILEGTLSWARQDWIGATSSFLRIAEASPDTVSAPVREYAVYALASVYLAQDEFEAALQRLSAVSDSAPEALQAAKWYQAGIIAYRGGLYEDAASYFRKSLEEEPSAIDAKINLELSQRSSISESTPRSSGSSGFREDAGNSGGSDTVFDYIRQKEENRWKNMNESEQKQDVADH